MNLEKRFEGGSVTEFVDGMIRFYGGRNGERPSVILMHPDVYYRYREEFMMQGRMHARDGIYFADVEVHESRDLEYGYVKIISEKVGRENFHRWEEERLNRWKEMNYSRIEMKQSELDMANHIIDSQNYLRQALGYPSSESLNIKAPNPFFVQPDIHLEKKEEGGLTFMKQKEMKL